MKRNDGKCKHKFKYPKINLAWQGLVNSLWPSDAIWHQRSWSSVVQVMLVAWWHQAVTWTNVDKPSPRSSDIHSKTYIDGSVQERHNSIANALELCLSCTNPSIWCLFEYPNLFKNYTFEITTTFPPSPNSPRASELTHWHLGNTAVISNN